MHAALVIDEILRLIFECILDEDKSSLCSVARCCRAWKDPALDGIWRRLPSAVPLLSLLPGFLMENDNIRFEPTTQDVTFVAFHSYAVRVKHIVYRHHILADPTSIPIHPFNQLSHLESARIESKAIGDFALRMCLAPWLRALTLQVGYTKRDSTSTIVQDMVSVLKGCSLLEQLSIRGYSSERLHLPLGSIATLRSLSLHLSSLTDQSFMTAATLPLLVDFDVHADHLSLSATIIRACDASFFPALEKLKIRAQPALVVSILRHLPPDKLRSLRIDATGLGSASAFDGLFKAMSTFPLHDFTLEHTVSNDDSRDIPAYTPFFTLDHLRPLSKLPLRSFILDSSLPPDLSDVAIEEMATWWPRLGRLQLGAHTALENTGTAWQPGTSLASLFALRKGCKHLESLVITLDADSRSLPVLSGASSLGSHPLTSLSISSRARPDVASFAVVLSRLFPSLVDVTPGSVGEHEDAWNAVQATVSNLVRSNPSL